MPVPVTRTLAVTPRRPSPPGRRTVLVGLGPIGRRIAERALGDPRLVVVAAVDPDPALAGRDLGQVLGAPACHGVTIVAAIEDLVPGQAEVAVHATSSRLDRIAAQLQALASRRLNVVSSAEELFYPWTSSPARAGELDAIAREHGVTLVGTGVNPGFVLDVLPATLAMASHRVRAIRGWRRVDVRTRREPLQRKVGLGLDPEVFMRRAENADIGHVGLPESVACLADALGWELDHIQDSLEPVIATRPLETALGTVPEGRVLGIHQTAVGFRDGTSLIHMDLVMAAGVDDPGDHLEIDGDPPVRVTVEGGLAGDVATAAMVVNLAARVVEAAPGLKLSTEIPIR